MKIKLTNSEIELSDEDIKTLQKVLKQHKKIQLEDNNFRVNSDGWKKITVNNEEYLVNYKEDIWEILHGECEGEQLFTWDAMMRETKKAGKRVPTDEEFDELEYNDFKNVKYSGYRNTSGTFYNRGSVTGFWSSLVSGKSAWYRHLNSSSSVVYRNTGSKANGFSVRCLKD